MRGKKPLSPFRVCSLEVLLSQSFCLFFTCQGCVVDSRSLQHRTILSARYLSSLRAYRSYYTFCHEGHAGLHWCIAKRVLSLSGSVDERHSARFNVPLCFSRVFSVCFSKRFHSPFQRSRDPCSGKCHRARASLTHSRAYYNLARERETHGGCVLSRDGHRDRGMPRYCVEVRFQVGFTRSPSPLHLSLVHLPLASLFLLFPYDPFTRKCPKSL